MARWIDSLYDHIVANGLGVDRVDLYVGVMEDNGQTGPVAALAPMNGLTVETMGDNLAIDVPNVQLSVRAPSYTDALDRATAIRSLLIGVSNQTVQGTHFLRVAPAGTIRDIGRDQKLRQMFTVEFEVWL